MIKRLGIDLHGVIDSDVDFFKETLQIIYSGSLIKIYVISGPPAREVFVELKEFGLEQGIHYHYVVSVVDHLRVCGVPMWKDYKNTWWADDKNWWGAKAAICKKFNIDLMIDDKERYKEYFKDIPTKFILYSGRHHGQDNYSQKDYTKRHLERYSNRRDTSA